MHSARCGRSATHSRTRGAKASTDATNLEPEWTQRATDLVLVVADLVDEELAAGEERPQLLALDRLHMHALEPPRAHELRDRARVVAVGLVVRHRRDRGFGMPGLMQHTRRPASFRPKYSHCNSGPASRPTRSNEPSNANSAALMAAGSDNTLASAAIRPSTSTTLH
jgi:hypothetical protein